MDVIGNPRSSNVKVGISKKVYILWREVLEVELMKVNKFIERAWRRRGEWRKVIANRLVQKLLQFLELFVTF